jgi:oligopeptide/dipeptide ABC transporter ATP-binding protein
MYLGKVVEQAPADGLFTDPRHPYTQALLAAAPQPDPLCRADRAPLLGEPPDPADPPTGCAFHPRCPLAEKRCRRETPVLSEHRLVATGHFVACHRAAEADTATGSMRQVGRHGRSAWQAGGAQE